MGINKGGRKGLGEGGRGGRGGREEREEREGREGREGREREERMREEATYLRPCPTTTSLIQ